MGIKALPDIMPRSRLRPLKHLVTEISPVPTVAHRNLWEMSQGNVAKRINQYGDVNTKCHQTPPNHTVGNDPSFPTSSHVLDCVPCTSHFPLPLMLHIAK